RRARREYRISSKECRMMKLGGTLINTGEPCSLSSLCPRWLKQTLPLHDTGAEEPVQCCPSKGV
ncbi:MAG: hypothetical protein R6U98_08690, partial [Pirellulaceae bacterium]